MTGGRASVVAGPSRRRFAVASAAAVLAGPALAQEGGPERWTIAYSAAIPIAQFRPYRTIVLDALNHLSTRVFTEQGKTVYARLDLFEIDERTPDFREVEAAKLLTELPPGDAGRRRAVDLRDPRWTKRLIEVSAPFLLHKGFHGLLLNGLHRAAAAERADPVRFKGMTEAAAHVVLALRRHYPEARLALKHMSPVLPAAEAALDAVVAVGTMGDLDAAGAAARPPAAQTAAQVAELQGLKRRRPGMAIYTLDRWNAADTAGIVAIYAAQRRNGFVPYVAGGDFRAILPEPSR